MEVVGLSPEEEDSFWLLLAAITNLGYLATQLGPRPTACTIPVKL
jgi:hypothetical protein